MAVTTASPTSLEQVRRSFFVTQFLDLIQGNQVFEQFAQQRSIGQGSSGFPETFQTSVSAAQSIKSIEFTGYEPLDIFDDSDNLAGSTGATVGGGDEITAQEITDLTTRRVNANIELYSKFVKIGRLQKAVAIDQNMLGAVELLSDQLTRSKDWLLQKLLLKNAVDTNLGLAPFSGDGNREIQILGANNKTTIAANGGAGGSAGNTNIVAAPEGLVGGGSNSGNATPSWYTLRDFRIVKALLDGERAMRFPGGTYVGIITSAIEERLLDDSDFIQAAKYADAMELFTGEIGQIHGVRMVKTSEFGWVVGVRDDADLTEGTETSGDDSSAGATGNVDVGTLMKPRQSIAEFSGEANSAGADTYWQEQTSSSGVTNSTGPLIPSFVMGMNSFGSLRLEGMNLDVVTTDGADKADPTNLFSTIGYTATIARIVLQARWCKVLLGAVDSQALSTYFTG